MVASGDACVDTSKHDHEERRCHRPFNDEWVLYNNNGVVVHELACLDHSMMMLYCSMVA